MHSSCCLFFIGPGQWILLGFDLLCIWLSRHKISHVCLHALVFGQYILDKIFQLVREFSSFCATLKFQSDPIIHAVIDSHHPCNYFPKFGWQSKLDRTPIRNGEVPVLYRQRKQPYQVCSGWHFDGEGCLDNSAAYSECAKALCIRHGQNSCPSPRWEAYVKLGTSTDHLWCWAQAHSHCRYYDWFQVKPQTLSSKSVSSPFVKQKRFLSPIISLLWHILNG